MHMVKVIVTVYSCVAIFRLTVPKAKQQFGYNNMHSVHVTSYLLNLLANCSKRHRNTVSVTSDGDQSVREGGWGVEEGEGRGGKAFLKSTNN